MFWNIWKFANKRYRHFKVIGWLSRIQTFLKKSLRSFFRGCLKKNPVLKVRKDFSRAIGAVQFIICYHTESWLHRKRFLWVLREFSKFLGKHPRWNLFLLKWQDNWNFYILQLCRKYYHVYWYVPKNNSSRNFEKSTGYNVTKNELLTEFLNSILKMSENVLEDPCNGVLLRELQVNKLQPSALCF